MKFCVSGRQNHETLKKADQVKLDYKDIDILYDWYEKYPQLEIIIDTINYQLEDIDISLLKSFSDMCPSAFYVAVPALWWIPTLKEAGIKYYWGHTIISFEELRACGKSDVSYALISGQVAHSLKTAKSYGIPLRIVPNRVGLQYLPQVTDLKAFFVRPEDINLYEEYIDAIEFASDSLLEERTCLDIYKNKKAWPGHISFLIKNIPADFHNQGLPDEFGETRLNCGLRCLSGGRCNFCNVALRFSHMLERESERRKQEKQVENNLL